MPDLTRIEEAYAYCIEHDRWPEGFFPFDAIRDLLSQIRLDGEAITRQIEVFTQERARADALAGALRMMVESYERHNEWCGNLASAPGASIHWQAIDAARAALAGISGDGE